MKRSTSEHRAIFIAEAGINHDGCLDKAKKMVDAAADSGADYVKFQSFKAKKLVTHDALTSSYIDEGSREGESFQDLLKRLELDEDAHRELKTYCDSRNIKFLSTAFDNESFDFLVSLGIDVVKIASGDLTNLPLIRHMAKSKLPIILSTGMASLGETEEAVNAILEEGNDQITLLHCISWYPAEIETTNLRYMETLKNAFPFDIGYSDHTLGINMSIAARVLGATVLEKHFTMDKTEFGPDHAASIEPEEMKGLILGIREVEKGLGTTHRQFCDKEVGQRKVHRRSLVLAEDVVEGEVFTKENLTIKRPGTGIKPKHFDSILGKKAGRNYKSEELLNWGDVVD